MKRLALIIVLLAAGCGSTRTVTVATTVTKTVTTTEAAPGPCSGSDLSATFIEVPGSAGAGNIVYRLKVKNSSSASCELTITKLQLLDARGNDVPTNAVPPPPGSIGTGESIAYDARFSPDVNGTGDNTNGQCQPTSATLRLSLSGGGTVDAPISPPTSVCEKGTMTFRAA